MAIDGYLEGRFKLPLYVDHVIYLGNKSRVLDTSCVDANFEPIGTS